MNSTIRDEFDFLPKSKIKAGEGTEDGCYPFFTSSDVKVMRINAPLYDEEAVILGTGGKPSCNYFCGKFSVSTDNFVLSSKGRVLPKYLYYFLRTDGLSILDRGFKGAGLKHISKEYVQNIAIPLLSRTDQEEVIDELDAIVHCIESSKMQINLLNEQVKSLFNELKRSHLSVSPALALEDVCSYVIDCPHTTPKYDEEQLVYPCIRTSEIGIGTISWETMKYVGEREYGERIARLQPKKGDIVFGREGTIGHAAILPEDNRFCLGQRTMIMRCKEKKCLPEFLLAQLLSDEIKELLLRRNVASTVAHVNVKEVRQIPIFCPPIDVQKAFANQLQQIDKLRFI